MIFRLAVPDKPVAVRGSASAGAIHPAAMVPAR
jgi:hypothetical protein